MSKQQAPGRAPGAKNGKTKRKISLKVSGKNKTKNKARFEKRVLTNETSEVAMRCVAEEEKKFRKFRWDLSGSDIRHPTSEGKGEPRGPNLVDELP